MDIEADDKVHTESEKDPSLKFVTQCDTEESEVQATTAETQSTESKKRLLDCCWHSYKRHSKMVAYEAFNVDNLKKSLAEVVISNEHRFSVIKSPGLIEFTNILDPRFVLPSRSTVAKDCMKVFADEKEKLKILMEGRRICLTTDCWTSNLNKKYVCLTGHWIDDEWNLHKKILGFRQVASHNRKAIGSEVELCLLDWGIDKIMTLTIDNASSNSVTLQDLTEKTKEWKSSILKNEYLHVTCLARIVSLIVKDCLKVESESIMKVRNAVRYVLSSPSRSDTFKKCIEKEDLKSRNFLCLDDDVNWDSTYLMLEAAVKFEKAFGRLNEEDPSFKAYFDGTKVKGPPTHSEWKNVRMFAQFLMIFHKVMLMFSGSLYVTSNTYFNALVTMHQFLNLMISSKDDCMSSMAMRVKMIYDKYWGQYEKINHLLYIAVVLDPRYKMKYIDICFKILYDSGKATEMSSIVKVALHKLYSFYETTTCIKVVEDLRSKGMEIEGDEDVFTRCLRFLERERELMQQMLVEDSVGNTSELDRYLSDRVEVSEGFDILKWWKANSKNFPRLSKMANEVLAIPVSTVSSESAFSTCGRVLDAYWCSLAPKTMEAIICSQNWLHLPQGTINLSELLSDVTKCEDIAEGIKFYFY